MHLLVVILEFAIVLGIMVLVHELGHFIVAKLCGVRIEAFSIGFGPRLFGIVYGGTDYKICALPLGGFVKMAGEYGADPATAAPSDFTARPRWQRILIALAGPFSNFLLALFLMTIVGLYHHEIDKYLTGPALVDYVPINTPAARAGLSTGDTIIGFDNVANPTWDQILEETTFNLNRSVPMTYLHNGQAITRNIQLTYADNGDFTVDNMTAIGLMPQMQAGPVGIANVSGGTAAAKIGLQPGDEIEKIDDLAPHSVQTLHAYLSDRAGAPSTLDILRHGQTLHFNFVPDRVDVDPKVPSYQIGFRPTLPPTDVVHLPFGQAFHESLRQNRHDSQLILRVLQGLFTHHVSVKQMSGPVGIAQDIDIATQMGIWPLIKLMSMISLNLGIFNLLPFPPLDGGMIFFLVLESLMRRDVNQRVKDVVYQVAFVCVIAFFFFVIFNDITKLHLGH
jgi:regulator of sigma E protease